MNNRAKDAHLALRCPRCGALPKRYCKREDGAIRMSSCRERVHKAMREKVADVRAE